jgi:hypothetical protein
MKLFTRREIIEFWNRHPERLDWFVCPNCRDLLFPTDTTNEFKCMNDKCFNYERILKKED